MKLEVIEIDGMKIKVKEIKLKTARKVLANVIELFQGDVNVEALINDKYDLLIEIASDFIVMPEGASLDDLTYSDLKDELYPVFERVNKRFLDDLMAFIPIQEMEQAIKEPQSPLLEDSTTQ